MNSKFLNFIAFFICANEIHGLGLPKTPCQTVGNKVCSADCTQVLLCTSIGHEPVLAETCTPDATTGTETYCDDTNPADVKCAATDGNCVSSQGATVKCVVFGEFPNPTKCGSTAKCSVDATNTVLADPINCNCPAQKFPNLNKPNLPCDQATCPYSEVKCEKPGQTGPVQNGSVFCYTCAVDATGAQLIYVHYCLNAKQYWSPKDFARADDGKQCNP